MLDIKFVRDNPDAVRENIKKKFQDAKLPLVDEVLELDAKNRAAITEASDLRASPEIPSLSRLVCSWVRPRKTPQSSKRPRI